MGSSPAQRFFVGVAPPVSDPSSGVFVLLSKDLAHAAAPGGVTLQLSTAAREQVRAWSPPRVLSARDTGHKAQALCPVSCASFWRSCAETS
eukprot:COSAG06_NODE_4394_length_4303_cov_2.828259_2_plen_91_part_00